MPRASGTLARELAGHYRYLEMTRGKIERLLESSHIVARDVNQVYVGLFLEVITSFERLLEELFLGLLTSRVAATVHSVVPHISFGDKRTAQAIVYGGRDFVNWLPYENTEDRARLFFKGGVPFTSLDATEKRVLADCMNIRNAMAHKSRHALNMFEKRVLGSLGLMPRERTPVGYLRSVYRVSPTQTRYESYVYNIAAIAFKLCS